MFGQICYRTHEPDRQQYGQDYENCLPFRILPKNKDDKKDKEWNPSREAGDRYPKIIVLFDAEIIEINKGIPIPLQDFFEQNLLSFDGSGDIADIFLYIIYLFLDVRSDVFADIVFDIVDVFFDILDKTGIDTLLIGTFLNFLLDVFGSIFQLAHTFAQTLGDTGNLIGTEDHHHDKHDKEYFCTADKKKMYCQHATNIMKF